MPWNAAEGDTSFFRPVEAGTSKKWMKPSHESTISLIDQEQTEIPGEHCTGSVRTSISQVNSHVLKYYTTSTRVPYQNNFPRTCFGVFSFLALLQVHRRRHGEEVGEPAPRKHHQPGHKKHKNNNTFILLRNTLKDYTYSYQIPGISLRTSIYAL